MRWRILLGGLCCAIVSGQTSAQVVINENVRFNAIAPSLGEYRIAASKCVTWDAPACLGAQPSVALRYDSGILDAGLVTLDEGIDLFVTQPNDVFTAKNVEMGNFPIVLNLVPPVSSPPAPVGTGDFYLGVRTGVGFVALGIPNRDVYGWVHLRPVNGILTMVENVMSYNSRGIVVGTTIVVPEPTSLAMVACGLVIGLINGRTRSGRFLCARLTFARLARRRTSSGTSS